jgi:hypothetical protein
VIGGRISAGSKAARRTVAEEFWDVECLGRRVDDIAFLRDYWAVDSFHDPLQLTAQNDPEFGEVGVHVAPVSWRALGVIALMSINKVAPDSVFALGRLTPRALALVGRLQILNIDMYAISGGIVIGNIVGGARLESDEGPLIKRAGPPSSPQNDH